jgi:hypothetical protein
MSKQHFDPCPWMGRSNNDDLTDLSIYNSEEDKRFLDNFWNCQSSSINDNNNIANDAENLDVHQNEVLNQWYSQLSNDTPIRTNETSESSSAPLQGMTSNDETSESSSAPFQGMASTVTTSESSEISIEDMDMETVSVQVRRNIHFKMFPRCSPRTYMFGYWLAQIFTLLYAIVLEVYVWCVHGHQCTINVDPQIYFAKEHSRHRSLFRNPAFRALVDSILLIPENEPVFLFVSDADRFGVVEEHLRPAFTLLRDRRNLNIVPVRQYNFPFWKALEIAIETNNDKIEIGKSSTNKNASKDRDVEGEDNMEMIEAIEEDAADIRPLLNDETSAESQIVRDAHSLGEKLIETIGQTKLRELAELLATKAKKVESDEITPEEAAKELKEFITSNFSDLPS